MNRETVVKKAVDVLINVPPSEVDEVLALIRQELVGKYRVYKAEELLTLANEQIARLRQRLCELFTQGEVTSEQVDAIVACLESKRDEAIAKVADVQIIGTHVPLLAAISKDFLTASVQMPMVQHGEKIGTNYLADDAITDEVELPEGCALWLTDVEDGQQFLGVSPKDAEAVIEEQGRLRVIATGAVALGIHTDVLSRHYVDAPGSRFKGAHEVPNLCLRDGKPGLGSGNVGDAVAEWGSASCSSYI